MLAKEITIRSKRSTEIPVTVVDCCMNPCGLIIFAHGFKANRTEDGRFLTVAEALSQNGFSSIMMGFPGCDVSEEDFFSYTLENCLDDIDSCVEYMKTHFQINDRIGMIGYSMGGRLTCLYINEHPEVKCIGIWAGACYEGFNNQEKFLGVPLEDMRKEAEENGFINFHNIFDDTWVKMNSMLLDNMESMSPTEGLAKYQGCAVIVHGTNDKTVPLDTAFQIEKLLENAKKKELVLVDDADHGFGAWDERPEFSQELTDQTIKFFRENL